MIFGRRHTANTSQIDRLAYFNICAIAAGATTISHVIIICYHLINRTGPEYLFIYWFTDFRAHRDVRRTLIDHLARVSRMNILRVENERKYRKEISMTTTSRDRELIINACWNEIKHCHVYMITEVV